MNNDIILASNSPRRQELLNQIGFKFQVNASSIHEDFSIDIPPDKFAEHYAFKKADDVSRSYPDQLVIGADTIVVLDNKILGKPKDAIESKSMLTDLSGNTHTVITGVSLINRELKYFDIFHVKTDVTFKTISEMEIDFYINNYHPFDKAGSYGIQDWFSVHVKEIKGCFYNVVGFPLSRFYQSYKKYSQIAQVKQF